MAVAGPLPPLCLEAVGTLVVLTNHKHHAGRCVARSTSTGSIHFTLLPGLHRLAPFISHCVARSTSTGSIHFTLCCQVYIDWLHSFHTVDCHRTCRGSANYCMMCCGIVSTVVTHLSVVFSTVVTHLPVVLSAASSHTYPWYCQHCRHTLTRDTVSSVVRRLWYC